MKYSSQQEQAKKEAKGDELEEDDSMDVSFHEFNQKKENKIIHEQNLFK